MKIEKRLKLKRRSFQRTILKYLPLITNNNSSTITRRLARRVVELLKKQRRSLLCTRPLEILIDYEHYEKLLIRYVFEIAVIKIYIRISWILCRINDEPFVYNFLFLKNRPMNFGRMVFLPSNPRKNLQNLLKQKERNLKAYFTAKRGHITSSHKKKRRAEISLYEKLRKLAIRFGDQKFC